MSLPEDNEIKPSTQLSEDDLDQVAGGAGFWAGPEKPSADTRGTVGPSLDNSIGIGGNVSLPDSVKPKPF